VPVTPISKEKNRQEAIKNYLNTTFQNDSSDYESIVFTKSQKIKPVSFKDLDSMYAIKYELKKNNNIDCLLEENIQIQRQIVLNDTNPILYLENHLFGVKNKNELTIYTGLLECTSQSTIKNVKINAGTIIPKEKLNYYKRYLFKESIMDPGYEPLYYGVNLYKKWKEKELT
jgi:hypothetical protein